MQGWPSGSVPQVLGLGRMGLGDLQKPPSHSTEEVPDSHRRLLGQGTLRRTQRLLTPSGLAPAFPQGRRGPRAACSCSCCWNSAWARSRSASTSSRWAAASLCRAWASGPAPRSGQGGQGGLAGPGKAATTHIRWLSLIPDLPCALRILKGGRAHTHSSPLPPQKQDSGQEDTAMCLTSCGRCQRGQREGTSLTPYLLWPWSPFLCLPPDWDPC